MVSNADDPVQTSPPGLEDRPEPPGRTGAGHQRAGLVAGPFVFLGLLLVPIPGLGPDAQKTAAVAALMAIWWMTEALPLPATSLVPLAVFPALGVLTPQATAAPYANPVIFLFLGGFLVALGVERWGLHRRIALAVLDVVGIGPRRIIGGFMIATAFLSMWISNTATAAMMLPIGLALAKLVQRSQPGHDDDVPRMPSDYPFGTALMLGIAYAATIGGVATLIGTPPNAVFAAAALEILGREIGFAEWMMLGLPVAVILLPIAWALLVYVLHPPGSIPPDAHGLLHEERAALGPLGPGERRVAAVFALTAAGWLFRSPKQIGAVTIPGLTDLLPGIDDSTIAMAAALLLFIVPVDWRRGVFLMDWRTARQVPWGVLLLFGGGLSLARAFQESGLTLAIAEGVSALAGFPVWVLILAIVATFVLLSELASNTAIAALAMPVLAAAAAGVGQEPLLFMAAGALAASAAYMMPVATPPNAVVFGSGYIRLGQMMRAGVWLNIIAIILLALLARVLVGAVLL